jgi:hypothetical protein
VVDGGTVGVEGCVDGGGVGDGDVLCLEGIDGEAAQAGEGVCGSGAVGALREVVVLILALGDG